MSTRGRNDVKFRQNSTRQSYDRQAAGDSRSNLNLPNIQMCNKIFITHFPSHFQNDDLANIFVKFGNVSDVNIVRDNKKAYGFLTFSSVDEANLAIREMHQKPPHNFIVNFAKERDDTRSTASNEEENRNDGQRKRSKSKTRIQRNDEDFSQTLRGHNKTFDNSCIYCGKNACCKCVSCGANYCSQNCQDKDWPEHMHTCVSKPKLIPLQNGENNFNFSETINHAGNKGFNNRSPHNKIIRPKLNVSFSNEHVKDFSNNPYSRSEPSVSQIVKELTEEHKQQEAASQKNQAITNEKKIVISPNNSDRKENNVNSPNNSDVKESKVNSPNNSDIKESKVNSPNNSDIKESKVNSPNNSDRKENKVNSPNNSDRKESPKVIKSPMLSFLTKLKMSKMPPVPPKQPWEDIEVLPKDCFTEISVVHVCEDSTLFYANIFEKQQVLLELMMQLNNDDNAVFVPMTPITTTGGLCLVSWEQVKYRGIIQSISPFSVKLMDFGYEVTVTEQDIFEPTANCAEFPAQAIYLKLAAGGLNNVKIELFENFIVIPTGEVSENATTVKLRNEKYIDDVPLCTIKKLKDLRMPHIKQNLSPRETKKLLNTSMESTMDFGTHRKMESPKESSLVRSLSNTNIFTSSRPRDFQSEAWKSVPVLPKTFTKVSVCYVEGDDIFVNLLSNMSICNSQLESSNTIKQIRMLNFYTGSLCIVPFEGLLYRALIKNISVNTIKVFLLDYGNTIEVSKLEVFTATEFQASAESQAIHIKLMPGSKRRLQFEEEIMIKPIRQIGDVVIVQIEGDLIATNSPAKNIEKPKQHALDYLELATAGNLRIQDRPCSDKFCLNLEVPDIQNLQKGLTAELRKFCEKTSPVSNSKIGENVIVQHEGIPYRGEVVARCEDCFYVSLTDVGKVISVKSVFPITSVIQYPTMAVLGRLKKIGAEIKEWEFAIKKKDQIRFTVVAKEHGISLVECKFLNYKGISFQMALEPWKPTCEQLHHGRIFLPALRDCSVMLTHFINQKSVFIRQTTSDLDNAYEKYLLDLLKYTVTAERLLTNPVIGEVVLAKFVEDDGFYKSIVREIEEDEVTVFYTDYGNTDTVKVEDLRALPDTLKDDKAFIHEVALADVPDGPLTISVVSVMTDIANRSKIEFKMKLDTKNKNHVHLFYPNGKSLNQKLAQLLTPAWHDVKDLSLDSAQDKLINETVLMKDCIREAEIPVGDNVELFIIDITNLRLSTFYACVPDQTFLVTMMVEVPKMLKEYATSVNIPYNPRIGELCVAAFTEDGEERAWLRAYCLGHEGEDCYVSSVDLGLIQYVPIKYVRRMTRDYLDMPALSAMFKIQGMPDKPVSPEIYSVLQQELLPCVSTIKFDNVRREEDGSYSVRLPKKIMDALLVL